MIFGNPGGRQGAVFTRVVNLRGAASNPFAAAAITVLILLVLVLALALAAVAVVASPVIAGGIYAAKRLGFLRTTPPTRLGREPGAFPFDEKSRDAIEIEAEVRASEAPKLQGSEANRPLNT
jgi:hypothetical protein